MLSARRKVISDEEVNTLLNKESGVLGISGVSSDFRDLEKAMKEGNKRAELALKVFARKVRFYIGAYIAEMNGADAIVLTGGIGENDKLMRELICKNMGNMGVKLDPAKNNQKGDAVILSTDDSKIKVLKLATNEELVIARDTKETRQLRSRMVLHRLGARTIYAGMVIYVLIQKKIC